MNLNENTFLDLEVLWKTSFYFVNVIQFYHKKLNLASNSSNIKKKKKKTKKMEMEEKGKMNKMYTT